MTSCEGVIFFSSWRSGTSPPPLPKNWPEEKWKYLRSSLGIFRGGKEIVVKVEFDAHQARYAHERKLVYTRAHYGRMELETAPSFGS